MYREGERNRPIEHKMHSYSIKFGMLINSFTSSSHTPLPPPSICRHNFCDIWWPHTCVQRRRRAVSPASIAPAPAPAAAALFTTGDGSGRNSGGCVNKLFSAAALLRDGLSTLSATAPQGAGFRPTILFQGFRGPNTYSSLNPSQPKNTAETSIN